MPLIDADVSYGHILEGYVSVRVIHARLFEFRVSSSSICVCFSLRFGNRSFGTSASCGYG